MNIQEKQFSEDLQQVFAMLGFLTSAYKGIKKRGELQEIGKDALKVMKTISKSITEADVMAYRSYVAAGMSSAEAVDVLIARKQNGRVTLSPDGKMFGKAAGSR